MSTSKNPRTFQIVAGISLNGKIAPTSGNFRHYSSKEDQAWLQKTIANSDVLIMGRKTYQKHVKKYKKPLIVFSRKIKGIHIERSKEIQMHWFNDSKEELLNLCNLLQYRRITILGGAQIYHWCITQELVTDLYLTVEPVLFNRGIHLIEGGLLNKQKKWKLRTHKKLNTQGSLLLHYQ